MELDSFDRKILMHFQRNTRLTANDLSELVGLSPSACHRRLSALRDSGVIEAEIAVIDPKAVGRRMTMIVTVTLEREHSDVITEFKRACREMHDSGNAAHGSGPLRGFELALDLESQA